MLKNCGFKNDALSLCSLLLVIICVWRNNQRIVQA